MKKWFKRIFIGSIMIMVLAIGVFSWFAKSNTKNWGDNPKILKVNDENKKIYLFATGGQINNDELNKMESNLGNVKATEKIEFKEGMKDLDKAYEVGKRIAGE